MMPLSISNIATNKMSSTTTLLVLITCPLLFNLPLNLVRLRWGLEQGLAPMPPEVEERATAADRVASLVARLLLMTAVVFLLRGSSISEDAVGLTVNNWESAVALGALLGCVPLGLLAFLRFVSPSKLPADPESRGSLAFWCGLAVLGPFSTELWRAFCIAALIRLDLSAWIAILATSVAFGASQLSTSVATALGAACFGGVAGFLFVKTGSLLAPLTMSLVAAGANLYRARHVSSRIQTRQAQASCILTCPFCGANFQPGKVKGRTIGSFTCPECGEELTHDADKLFYYLWFPLSVCVFPLLLYLLGVRSFFAFVTGPVGFYVIGIIIYSLLNPSQIVQKEGYGGLRLTNKPKPRKDDPPTDA